MEIPTYINSLQPASVIIISITIYFAILLTCVRIKLRKRVTKDMFITALDLTLKERDPCSTCIADFIPLDKKERKKTCYWCRKLVIEDRWAWIRLKSMEVCAVELKCPCFELSGDTAKKRAGLLIEERREAK